MPQFDPNTGLPITEPPPAAPAVPAGLTINVGERQLGTPAAPQLDEGQLAELEAWVNAERERVRTEEKNKLYPEIEELRGSVATLAQERADRLAADEAQRAAAEEAERVRQEAEMSQLDLFNRRQEEFARDLAAANAERDTERALREKETQRSALVAFRATRVAEEAADIMPQFVDYIVGNTPEEIEASIVLAKEKTAQVVADVQSTQLGQRRREAPGVTGGTPVDMLGGGESQRTLTAEDIRDMSMAEYNQYRSQILSGASEHVRTNGLYAP